MFFFFGEARRRKRELKAWRARESREDTSRRRSGGETEKAWRPLRRFNILEHAENLVMHLFRVKTRNFFLKDMVPWYKSGEISNYVKEKKKAK